MLISHCCSNVNDNLENQIQTIYDYWFSQFDFPDSKGNPYKSNKGQFKWNDTIKRDIPTNWSVGSVAKNTLTKFIKPGVDKFELKTYLATADVKGSAISEGTVIDYDNRESRANMQPTEYSVWFAKMKNSIKHITIPSNGQWFIDKYILSTGMYGFKCSDICLPYLSAFISSEYFEKVKNKLSHGATQESVNDNDLKRVKFLIPEDRILMKFYEKTNKLLLTKFDLIKENQNLQELRDLLTPLLLREQIKFCN